MTILILVQAWNKKPMLVGKKVKAMSNFKCGYVPLQSLKGAKRMVWGMLARELAKGGLQLSDEYNEKLVDLYVTLKEANYGFEDIVHILEGYAMRLEMNIYTAKRVSDGKIIKVYEKRDNSSATKVVVINEVPKRKIYQDRKGSYVNFKSKRYYFD